jgi:hypothetical protein
MLPPRSKRQPLLRWLRRWFRAWAWASSGKAEFARLALLAELENLLVTRCLVTGHNFTGCGKGCILGEKPEKHTSGAKAPLILLA